MNLNEYQENARAFRAPTANMFYAITGLAAEAGEVCDKVAKAIRDGHGEDQVREGLKKELGDLLWFVAAVADDNNLTLEEIATANIDKLTSRQIRGVILGSGDDR